MTYKEPYPIFLTATILYWNQLLKDDAMKDIILKSLKFLSDTGRLKVFGLVVMPNHIHLIWQISPELKPDHVQRDFLRYTAQQFKFRLLDMKAPDLKRYYVGAKDREYQFWERNAWHVNMLGESMLRQKLRYIHKNPLQERWRLVDRKEEYLYSSANFYQTGMQDFGFLKHYRTIR